MPSIRSPGLWGRAAGRAGYVQPIGISGRLVLGHFVGAGHQAVDVPRAVRHGVGVGRLARGHVGDRQIGAADALFAGVHNAVVVGIVINIAAELGGLHFGKVVLDAVVAAVEVDAAENVNGGHHASHFAVHRAGGVADAQIAIRLRLDHLVGAGQKSRELVIAVGIGGGGLAVGHIIATGVQFVERQLHAGDAQSRRFPVCCRRSCR